VILETQEINEGTSNELGFLVGSIQRDRYFSSTAAVHINYPGAIQNDAAANGLPIFRIQLEEDS
jgi:hypothetical protein